MLKHHLLARRVFEGIGREHQPNHSNNLETIALRFWHSLSPAHAGQQTIIPERAAPTAKNSRNHFINAVQAILRRTMLYLRPGHGGRS